MTKASAQWEKTPDTNAGINKLVKQFAPLAETSRDLIKQTDLLYKLASRLIETCENECEAKESNVWVGRDITRARKSAAEARQLAVEQLKQVRYFWRQAHWLTKHFPEAKLCGVERLVKLVDRAEIEANDWSLSMARLRQVATNHTIFWQRLLDRAGGCFLYANTRFHAHCQNGIYRFARHRVGANTAFLRETMQLNETACNGRVEG